MNQLEASKYAHVIAREASIAAEHLGIGVTALGKASFAHPAYYGQAFFALCVGLERSAKLTLVVDHATRHGGEFPNAKLVRSYGHNLVRLLDEADRVAERLGLSRDEAALPRLPVHVEIVKVLSSFAENRTRYHSFAVLSKEGAGSGGDDPTAAWFERVTLTVLGLHCSDSRMAAYQDQARTMESIVGRMSTVCHTSECGEPVRSVEHAQLLISVTEFAKPFTRMYVLQFARFFAHLMSHFGQMAYQVQPPFLPVLSEFYSAFRGTDAQFRKRRRWSIY
jgi:hypothetical protein